MTWMARLYEAGILAGRPLLEAGSVLNARARRAVQGRRESLPRLESWAARSRATDVPLVWVHAPSVGESLMANAIVAELRKQVRVQIAFTFFSTSAERTAENVGADVVTYLPWDVRRDVVRALDALRPSALVFVRTEIWPTLVREAAGRGISVLLVNAPLSKTSSRLAPVARRFLTRFYKELDAVAAVADEDVMQFERLGVARDRVHILGDARFDQVWARVKTIDHDEALLQRLREPDVFVVVAGSTWPEDEDRIVPAFAELRKRCRMRLVIAPHEPTRAHVQRLEGVLNEAGIAATTLNEVESGAEPSLPPAIIVDRVGVLAKLYTLGRVAYVGGGFGRRGLHSVIEPAAVGCAVIFGPNVGNAREAARLEAAGGGERITDTPALEQAIRRLLNDSGPGRKAREFVIQNLGAGARIAQLITDTISRTGTATRALQDRFSEGG